MLEVGGLWNEARPFFELCELSFGELDRYNSGLFALGLFCLPPYSFGSKD